ncbi:MAG TPA: hypothetical protein VGS61_00600, partial [Acidimicrobiales bacterium]|nr:hypothetical protein [Acidimicrobiales bacterium]
MTFRSRVIAGTVGVAAVAVVLASLASYLTTRTALLHSVDVSLDQAALRASSNYDESLGAYVVVVLPSGQTSAPTAVPIDATVLAVAKGSSPRVHRTISFRNEYYRELIVPLPKGTLVGCTTSPTGACQLSTTSAALFIVNFTGQESQLHSLVRTLLVVAAAGLL